MADRLPSFYAVGTATVEQGGTVVTGQDTLWAGKIWPGDRFGTHLGFGIRVLSVDSNEQLTLAYPCPFAQAAAAYEIGITPDTARMQETTRLLMTKLRNGNLEAFSDIAGNIDMVPVFTGPGAMDAVALSELTRGIDVDAKVATLAERDAFDDRASGFSVLVNNIGDGRAAIYTKVSAAVGDWSVPAVITGPQGALTPFEFVAPEELAPGSTPTVSNTGTPTAPKMKFGIPAGRGFYSKGDYAAGTTYQTDDVVLFNGSSWIAVQETTGNAPPALPATENAWWRLIAKKGADGLGTVTELVEGTGVAIDSTDPTKPVVGLAAMPAKTLKGNDDAAVGPAKDLAPAEVRALIGVDRLAGFRNKIINPDFEIHQRDSASVTDNDFFADRWRATSNGSTKTFTRQRFTSGQTDVPGNPVFFARAVVSSVAGASNYAFMQQRIPSAKTLSGGQATVTFWARAEANRNLSVSIGQNFGSGGSPSSSTSLHVGKVQLTTQWQKFSLTVEVPSIAGKTVGTTSDGYMLLTFWMDAGSSFNAETDNLGQQSGTFEFAHVSLVEGDASAERDPTSVRSLIDEWSLCRHFYNAIIYLQPRGYAPGSSAWNQFPITFDVMNGTPSASITMRLQANVMTADCLPTSAMAAVCRIRSAATGDFYNYFDLYLDAEI